MSEADYWAQEQRRQDEIERAIVMKDQERDDDDRLKREQRDG